jgi:hypothetical protein
MLFVESFHLWVENAELLVEMLQPQAESVQLLVGNVEHLSPAQLRHGATAGHLLHHPTALVKLF